jgi:hypothetical protein
VACSVTCRGCEGSFEMGSSASMNWFEAAARIGYVEVVRS